MPTLIEIEKTNAEYVYGQLRDKAFAVWVDAFQRMVPAPVYPGGPVECPAHDTAPWSADKIAVQSRVMLLAALVDVIQNALADMPQAGKDFAPSGWENCTNPIDSLRDALEAFPAE